MCVTVIVIEFSGGTDVFDSITFNYRGQQMQIFFINSQYKDNYAFERRLLSQY